MPDITLTVNGQTVTVPAGTNVVDAARAAATAIPVFCYHPKLPAVGMCRMCLVQVGTPKVDPATKQPVLDDAGKPVIQMMPKLQTGCTTPASEGMVVNTLGDEVKFAQKGVLEFLLTSHPLDCPVCDKGGECPLQNLTMGWGPGKSRFEYEDKVHFEKPYKLGNLIHLDRERCILCSRCTRFEDEIAGDPVLGFDNRGRSWMIISKSEPYGFDSKFSGNTTDICPVGALTSADFRFKARVWELRPVPSLDTHGCAGANITLDMRYNNLMRVMPRENDYVNEIWIADKTRYGTRYVESEARLQSPLIRCGDALVPATWEEALAFVAERLGAIKEQGGGQAIGGIAGDRASNEELFAFRRLLTEVLGSSSIDHRSGASFEGADDTLVARYGVGKGTNLSTLGKGTAVLVVGADPEEEEPIYLLRLRGIARRGGELIVANSRPTKLSAAATHPLRTSYGAEAVLVLALCQVIVEEKLADPSVLNARGFAELRRTLERYTPATIAEDNAAQEAIRAAARAYAGAEHGLLVYGREALSADPRLLLAMECLTLLSGKYGRAGSGLLAILPGPNTRGALDQGFGTGTQRAPQMMQAAATGRLKALLVLASDPARENPQSRQALAGLELLVVQDMFLSETAQLAHVVLPQAAVAESDGTYTNAERRVQRFRQARTPEGMSRTGWEAARDLAQLLLDRAPLVTALAKVKKAAKGKDAAPAVAVAAPAASWDYVTASDVATALSQSMPAYRGVTYKALAATGSGGTWGRQVNESVYYDGTSYENSEGIGIQLAAEAAGSRAQIAFPLLPEAQRLPTSADYPLLLVPITVSYCDADPLLIDSLLLDRLAPVVAQISVADAARLGVTSGQHVRLTTAQGAIVMPALLNPGLADGLVLAPLGMRAAPIEVLLSGPTTAVRLEKEEAA